jgi:hypothetical protein
MLGQGVQVLVTVCVLAVAFLPGRLAALLLLALGLGAAGALAFRAPARDQTAGVGRRAAVPATRWRRALGAVAVETRTVLGATGTTLKVAGASLVVVAGHLAVLLVAVRVVGSGTPLTGLVPAALLVLLAAAVPFNIAGWGPREGAAAWAFASAGMTEAQGVTVAAVYGVLATVAALPGVVALLASRRASGRRLPSVGPVVQAHG